MISNSFFWKNYPVSAVPCPRMHSQLRSLFKGETVFHHLGVFASNYLPVGLLPGLLILSTYFQLFLPFFSLTSSVFPFQFHLFYKHTFQFQPCRGRSFLSFSNSSLCIFFLLNFTSMPLHQAPVLYCMELSATGHESLHKAIDPSPVLSPDMWSSECSSGLSSRRDGVIGSNPGKDHQDG